MSILWLFHIAMENGTFIDGLPIKNGDYPWLCQITRWYIKITNKFAIKSRISIVLHGFQRVDCLHFSEVKCVKVYYFWGGVPVNR